MHDSWLDELRRIHDEHFNYGWHEHLPSLIGSLGPGGTAAPGLAALEVGPSWLFVSLRDAAPSRGPR